MFKNVLVSVSDKSFLADFFNAFKNNLPRIVSTGGTAKYLRENGFKVVDVSEQTGFSEVMDGRVKTLHPNIHMALLAREKNDGDLETLSEFGLNKFDLVIGNLYPFEKKVNDGMSINEAMEFVDIGGPSFLRAAAKNFESVTVIVDPKDYKWISEKGELTLEDRKKLAVKVFSHVSVYDSMISDYLNNDLDFQTEKPLGGKFVSELRYGENSHQKAAWYRWPKSKTGLNNAEIIQGKELSYNNLLDLEAAARASQVLGAMSVVVVKHNNPCGAAVGTSIPENMEKALAGDPISAFGGIIAVNGNVDEDSVEFFKKMFIECIVAVDFSKEALAILAKKKNLRVLKWKDLPNYKDELELRTIQGGFLVQTRDRVDGWQESWKVLGESPSEQVKRDLEFAWKVVGQLKSNAIAIIANNQTVGLGMGQVNRVDAVRQSIDRMKSLHPEVKNPVLASDAFFPFADSIEVASEAGIKWVIQPGGSVKDSEIIDRAKELGVNLVLTGRRHFRH